MNAINFRSLQMNLALLVTSVDCLPHQCTACNRARTSVTTINILIIIFYALSLASLAIVIATASSLCRLRWQLYAPRLSHHFNLLQFSCLICCNFNTLCMFVWRLKLSLHFKISCIVLAIKIDDFLVCIYCN